MEERQDYKVFWIIVIALLLLTRIPAMATYLSIDNVNLAFSLEKFDPRIHQPQPPGYPLFVFFARIVNFFVRDPERTFVVISLLVCAACLPVAFALGQRMFSKWAGAAGAMLLLVNPVFWQASLDGPLRPNLALFSLLTAYCCWRSWNGEKRFVFWGAVALGIGSGFRPDLAAFLLPIWLVTSWVGTRSWKSMFQAWLLLGAIVLVWLGAMIFVMGGLKTFLNIMLDYAADQSRAESVVLGSSIVAWRRQISRLVIWNGLAAVTWIWAVPFYFRHRERLPLGSLQAAFFFIWLVPGLIVQGLLHIAAAGHTLFSVAALCVLGGYVLSLVPGREVVLAGALIVNTMLFLDFLPTPVNVGNDSLSRGNPSITNAMFFGTYEASINMVRGLDSVTRDALAEIKLFTPSDRPSMIISSDTYVDTFFMNWRIARYYLPDRDIWVFYRKGDQRGIQRVRREKILDKIENVSFKVPIFSSGRIIWLIEPNGELHNKLKGTPGFGGGRVVFYTDIAGDSTPIHLDGIELAPTPFGFTPNQVIRLNDKH